MQFVSKQAGYEQERKLNPQAFALIGYNPLPDIFRVTPSNPSDAGAVRAELDQSSPLGTRLVTDPAIAAVQNRQAETNKILSATRVIKLTMALLAALLVLASVLLISNTIRLSLFSRRREVEVMKLVGATDWFIRWPFVIEGLFLGALGGAAAIGLLALAKVTLVDPLANTVKLISQPDMIAFPLLIAILMGCAVGVSAPRARGSVVAPLSARLARRVGAMSSRRRLTYVLVAMLPILLVVGVWWGGHPEDLPAFARSGLVAHADTRVVDEAIERISSDYYRPVPTSSLANASVAGAVASLHDRFSHYLSPKEFHDFDEPPSFTGIGVEVQPEKRGLLIARVFNSSPASRAGLKAGESIVAVNGRSIAGVSPDGSRALIVGPPGTDVTLSIEPARGARRAADGEAHPRDDLRAGRGLGDRGRCTGSSWGSSRCHVQPGFARRSAGSRRKSAPRRRAGDRAGPARQRRRPGRGSAADREHLHRARHDRDTRGRARCRRRR